MTVLPYGAWPSPITARSLVQGAVGIAELVTDGEDIWWSESRPDEGGRTALIRWRDGAVEEITPPDAYVRTLVHEYGGGSWWVQNGIAYYVDVSDQRLRRLEPGQEPTFLTPEPDTPRGLRFADLRVDPAELDVEYGYLGGGYGVVGDLERDAIARMAQTEGVLLGPVYSGRGFGALVEMIASGQVDQGASVLYWHTGDEAALHAYSTDVLPQ